MDEDGGEGVDAGADVGADVGVDAEGGADADAEGDEDEGVDAGAGDRTDGHGGGTGEDVFEDCCFVVPGEVVPKEQPQGQVRDQELEPEQAQAQEGQDPLVVV